MLQCIKMSGVKKRNLFDAMDRARSQTRDTGRSMRPCLRPTGDEEEDGDSSGSGSGEVRGLFSADLGGFFLGGGGGVCDTTAVGECG